MFELTSVILRTLVKYSEEEYAVFSAKITPTKYSIMGVRMPIQKKLALYVNCQDKDKLRKYLAKAQPSFFEELNVYGLAIAYASLSDEERMKCLYRYFGMVDNWASCDSIVSACKFLGKKLDTYQAFVAKLLDDDRPFVVRAGIVSMMTYYLNDEYIDWVLNKITKIDASHYYVSMAIAWLVATALAKNWGKTVAILEDRRLDVVTHNRAIAKARESYRIEPWQKEYLKGLKA